MFKQLALAVGLLTATSATSADFWYAEGKVTHNKYIIMSGDIVAGDSFKLTQMYQRYPQATHVAMASPGGSAREGYLLGNTISELGLKTSVAIGSICLSACYTAFLGGHDYEIYGVLGAHVAWSHAEDSELTDSQLMQQGQILGSYDTIYHLAHGFNTTLPYTTNQYTSKDTFLVFTHEDQLMQYYARSDEDHINDYITNLYHKVPSNIMKPDEKMAALLFKRVDKEFPNWFDPRMEEL